VAEHPTSYTGRYLKPKLATPKVEVEVKRRTLARAGA